MSHTMLNGQSVLMPPGLQCVPETRYPALMIADLNRVLLGAEALMIPHRLEVVKKSGTSLSSSLTAVSTAATLSPQGYLPPAPPRSRKESISFRAGGRVNVYGPGWIVADLGQNLLDPVHVVDFLCPNRAPHQYLCAPARAENEFTTPAHATQRERERKNVCAFGSPESRFGCSPRGAF